MLFQKSLLRELRSTAGGVLAVLLTTLVTMILIRALGRAASGKVDGDLVLPLIVFNTISLMNSVLMLTVYISVLMVLSRWWKDSEMVIWLSSGKSLTDLVRPVLTFLWPIMLIVAVLSVSVGPWARLQIMNFEDEIKSRGDAQRVSPGQFRESFSGQRVFFLENLDDENGRIGTVFIRSTEAGGRQSILVSTTGRFEKDAQGFQWVVLEGGYRTDISPGKLESQTMGFESYRVRLDQSTPVVRGQESAKTMAIGDLMDRPEPSARGEILMRIGIPLLTLALGLLAIPLAVSNARSGRATNLIIALLIYLIASNLFSAVKASVSQGSLSLAMAWWPVPLGLMVLAAVMMAWRLHQKESLIDWLFGIAARMTSKLRPAKVVESGGSAGGRR